jgi:uroporphyrinogen decarboxylase
MSLDVKRFWDDDKAAHEDNCFSEKAPQMAFFKPFLVFFII